MPHSQPDHEDSIQEFLEWERQVSTRRNGTIGPQNDETQDYVPLSALNAHFKDESVVRRVISDLGLQDPPSAYYVRDLYLQVFAILLSIHKGSMIRQFTNREYLNDQYLPFRAKPSDFPASSDDLLWTAFQERQWRFRPVKMRNGMSGEQPPAAILPFTVDDQIGDGVSASIHKIMVDSEYNSLIKQPAQSDNDNHKNIFVLKTYKKTDAQKNFYTEKRAFEKLNSAVSPLRNIVAYYGSFSRNEVYNIVLEYADQGSLRDFMRRREPPSIGEDILKFWEALAEVLNGLQTIHEAAGNGSSSSEFICGWHQDIKPENILVKSKPGSSVYDVELVVADLGLSHFKPRTSDSVDEKDGDTRGSRAYGAPETFRINDTAFSAPRKVSRSIDIFSMGCIYSEIATWIVYGLDRVTEYRNQRRAEVIEKLKNRDDDDGDMFHNGEKILDVVTDNHNSMVTAGLRVDDYITLQVVHNVVPDMMEKPTVCLTAPQAHGRIINIAREARENLEDLRQGRAPRHIGKGPNPPIPCRTSLDIPDRGSLQETQSVPWMNIETVLEKKRSNDLQSLPDLHYLVDNISKRDNVFIFDNSSSMLDHKVEGRKVLLALAYLVKRYDPNGIDLLFTHSSRKVTNTKRSQKFMDEFDKVRFQGRTAMNMVLEDVLVDYKRSISESHGVINLLKRAVKSQSSVRPLSLYILTDGIWQPGSDVAEVITSMVEFLDAHKDETHQKQVAIQFIRFGDNQDAIDILDYLDDKLKLKIGRDIVDHTPWDDNAWKMVLGAILPWFDRQQNIQSPPPPASPS